MRGDAAGKNQPMRRYTVMLAAMVCTFALGACGTSSKAAKKDVTVTSCKVETSGARPIARGHITNHSSKASFYTIHVKFKDASGNRVADGVAAVAKVDAGKTANWHADASANAKGPLTCTLANVTRTIAP
jgi:FlaG/FlaF family flagellin (archaellin)